MLQIGSKTMQIEEIETEDATRDMTQNPNHYLTDAEIRHTKERGFFFFFYYYTFFFTGNSVRHRSSERSITMIFFVNPFWQGQSKSTLLVTARAVGIGKERYIAFNYWGATLPAHGQVWCKTEDIHIESWLTKICQTSCGHIPIITCDKVD